MCVCSLLLQDELMESSSDEDESAQQDEKKSVVDVEDLGNLMTSARKAKVRGHSHSPVALSCSVARSLLSRFSLELHPYF